MSERRPETSVVIRALNEERWLPDVLGMLERQTYRDFEILVVDSGSVDRTRDIAAAAGARIVRLRSEDFTFGHSLNVGIREAHGKFIAILSAHAIPVDEAWLERLVAPLRQDSRAMVYGGQIGHPISKFSEARDFERLFPQRPHTVDPEEPFANNANSAIRRACWEEQPFDEGLPGLEDIGWAKHWMAKGREVVYEPKACIIHVHTETWPQVRRRFYREAMAARWIGLKIVRHIPGEVWRELRWLTDDLRLAAAAGRLRSSLRQIVRFRYEKTIGTIGGIVDSRGLDNPARRSEMFYQRGFPAVVIRGPNNARLEERGVPSLKPGEVLVRVSYVGICATDLEVLEGTLGYYRTGKAHYPIVPGHESSGTVVAVGPRVTSFTEGDRVVVECIQGCGECPACARDDAIQCRERREVGVMAHDGAYATYLVTRARYVHRVPDAVTLAQAALTEPLAVVHKGLRRLGSRPQGDRPRRCAVVGAGTIGQLSARVLALRGHAVTVFDRQQERLSLLQGIAEASTSMSDLASFEWLVEATGQQSALTQLLDRAPTGATILLLGLPYAPQTFSFESLVAYDRSVVGSVGSNGADFEEALATLAQIDTAPFLGATFALEEFENAWSVVRSRSVLKVMLRADASQA
jgi:2-desacetyl-2-hydroxyethyl bacteriochlorophyllide A dehydrogenase